MIRLSSFLIFTMAICGLAADWPQFLGPHRNNVASETNLSARWPGDGPKRLWVQTVGQGFSGPIVAQGKCILFHRVNDEEVVDCFNAINGTRLWRTAYPTAYRDDFGFDEGPRATPAIADGKVFSYGAEGRLQCLDLASGRRLWLRDLRKELGAPKGFFGIASSPLPHRDQVIVQVGGPQGASVVAFSATNGATLWKAGEDEASYSSPIVTRFNGLERLLTLTRDHLLALDPVTGKILTQHDFQPSMRASVTAAVPLVVSNEVFISASYGAGAAVLRWTDNSFSNLWSADDVLSNHYATSVEHDGFLYGFDGRQEQGCRLRCVEWRTGKVRWTEEGFGAGTLICAGNQLLILTERGELRQAKATPARYELVQRAQILGFESRAHPALADGLLFARSKQQLACFDLRAGATK